MNESCDFEAIEISWCPMQHRIVEMEESAPEPVLGPILRPFFIEIGQDFFDKEFTVEYLLWW
jgi:hypothetical protein